MLQTSLLLMKSLNKTETPIFLFVVCSLFPKAIFLTFIHLDSVKKIFDDTDHIFMATLAHGNQFLQKKSLHSHCLLSQCHTSTLKLSFLSKNSCLHTIS